MGGNMYRDGFTEDQISRLKQNPYIESVSKDRIKFSKSLRVMVADKIAEGEKLSSILFDVGIDAHWLSKDQKRRLTRTGIDTGCKYLTEEEQNTLSRNRYISRVSKKSISYTDEFYNEFAKEYSKGTMVQDILRHLGIDPVTLGKKRRDGIVARMKRYQERAGNGAEERTAEEEIAYLRQRNAYL